MARRVTEYRRSLVPPPSEPAPSRGPASFAPSEPPASGALLSGLAPELARDVRAMADMAFSELDAGEPPVRARGVRRARVRRGVRRRAVAHARAGRSGAPRAQPPAAESVRAGRLRERAAAGAERLHEDAAAAVDGGGGAGPVARGAAGPADRVLRASSGPRPAARGRPGRGAGAARPADGPPAADRAGAARRPGAPAPRVARARGPSSATPPASSSCAPRRAGASRAGSRRCASSPARRRRVALHRRGKELESAEALGGPSDPLVGLRAEPGAEPQLVLGPQPGRRLVVLPVEDNLAFVREDVLAGFELHARLRERPRGAREGAPTTACPSCSCGGPGPSWSRSRASSRALPSRPGKPLLVRREWIVGWLGRLVPACPSRRKRRVASVGWWRSRAKGPSSSRFTDAVPGLPPPRPPWQVQGASP